MGLHTVLRIGKKSTPVYLQSIKVLLLGRNVGAELRQHLRALGLVTRVQRANLDLHRLHLCACACACACACECVRLRVYAWANNDAAK
jgi:hypothetical protein